MRGGRLTAGVRFLLNMLKKTWLSAKYFTFSTNSSKCFPESFWEWFCHLIWRIYNCKRSHKMIKTDGMWKNSTLGSPPPQCGGSWPFHKKTEFFHGLKSQKGEVGSKFPVHHILQGWQWLCIQPSDIPGEARRCFFVQNIPNKAASVFWS